MDHPVDEPARGAARRARRGRLEPGRLGGTGQRRRGAGDRRAAPLRGLPEPLGGRFALGDRAPNAGDHPRTTGSGRDARAGQGVFRREIRAVDPARAAASGLEPARVGDAVRRPPGRARRGRPTGEAMESTTARRRGGDAPGGRCDEAADQSRARRSRPMSTAQLAAIAVLVLPALAIVLWPLLRGRRGGRQVPAVTTSDNRLELLEEKASVYRALKEIAFDHEAGHLSDDDYHALAE